ncbi:MAG TPA: hypothetical protein VFA59_15120 [Vicinamibacterales bacterium]|nr:hypothetical protein [Vicinamibacterales bacterium]
MFRWQYAAIGASTFALAHTIEWHFRDTWFHGAYTPWFLDSGPAIAFTMVSLFIVGVTAGSANRREAVTRSSNAWVGASLAMAVTLFVIGPGTIFPIVIVGGALVLALAIAAGALLGSLLRLS